MKKSILLLFIAMFVTSLTQAQIKPVAGDISLGFQITGLANIAFNEWGTDEFDVPQILGRYYLADNLAIRARIGLSIQNTGSEFSVSYIDSVRFPEARRVDSATNSTFSGSGFSITPGAEYHLGSEASKLDPYVGAEIPFAIQGASTSEVDLNYTQSNADNAPLYKEDLNIVTKRDGGLSVGLSLIGGFNYFFSEKFAIGAEYSIGFLYTKVGGDVTISETGSIQPDGNQSNLIPVNVNQRFQQLSTSTGVNTASTGGVNISVFW